MMSEASELGISHLNTSCRSSVYHKAYLSRRISYCLSLLIILLNMLVIISISHFRQLQTPTNIILLSLAVSDFLVGISVIPFLSVPLGPCSFTNKLVCTISYPMGFILTSTSVGHMVLISVDRYVAICKPLHYSSTLTHSRVQICVSVLWIYSFVYNFIMLKDHIVQIDLYHPCCEQCLLVINFISGVVDFLLTFLSPVTVIITLYMKVFLVAVSQARLMRSQASGRSSNRVSVKKSDLKAARTLGIILLVFILCFSSFYLPTLVGQNIKNDENTFLPIVLFYSNSAFNPLVYAFFYTWFRKAVKLIVSLQILKPGSRTAKLM